MNTKSILMPHACQKIGWWLLLLFVILWLVNVLLFRRNIDVSWYLAKSAHLTFIVSIFLICLSKEKVEDEMISGLRLRSIGLTAYVFFSIGLTAYVFFVLFLLLSLFLELQLAKLFPNLPENLELYMSEFFLILLPLCLFALYYGLFRWMLCKSRK